MALDGAWCLPWMWMVDWGAWKAREGDEQPKSRRWLPDSREREEGLDSPIEVQPRLCR